MNNNFYKVKMYMKRSHVYNKIISILVNQFKIEYDNLIIRILQRRSNKLICLCFKSVGDAIKESGVAND